jgi:hypothetical protein
VPGWVQIAFNTSEDHVPKNPTNGLPGKWIKVYGGFPPIIADAWIPTPEPPVAPPKTAPSTSATPPTKAKT